jgi:hypothetical protein
LSISWCEEVGMGGCGHGCGGTPPPRQKCAKSSKERL